MGIFSGLSTEGLEKNEDRVGGGSWVRDTDIVEFTIKALYAGKSTSSNAQSVTFIGVDADGKEYRETFWITSGAGLNYYMAKDKDKKETGKRNPLPGFAIVNDICMVASDKPLNEQDTEEKTFKVYDPDAKQELPKAVPMLVECIGKKVALAIYRVKENKTQKNQTTGAYEAIAEEREVNVAEKAMFPQFRCTVREAEQALENGGSVAASGDAILNAQGEDVAVFWPTWLEAHKGKIRDKRTIKDGAGGQQGRPGRSAGAPPSSSGGNNAGGERKSLFNKG
ncbi:hypothetical protein [Aquabacterium sp.]|uniref:hypothetical protein n=1 Tax=Aquabacterium sp. TaxID=1872578 RepID=UPI0025C3641B|nr:hypothetical protein [Aquabacterium sp.]